MTNKILMIDDNLILSQLISEYLSADHFEMMLSHNGIDGLEILYQKPVDLIILDIMMKPMDGFSILKQIRESYTTPVLMLTARGQDIDKITGLELGADDYLAKPFNPRELVARIRAILRRTPHAIHPKQLFSVIQVANLRLDMSKRELYYKEKQLELTSSEFNLIEILFKSVGQVVTKESLSHLGLGKKLAKYDRSLDMHISHLRKKLARLPEEHVKIKTIRNMGYMLHA